MKAIILRAPSSIANIIFMNESGVRAAKLAYCRHEYDTDGDISADVYGIGVEDFIEECFDVTNNPSRKGESSKGAIKVGDILIIVDIGGAWLCKSVGWERIE